MGKFYSKEKLSLLHRRFLAVYQSGFITKVAAMTMVKELYPEDYEGVTAINLIHRIRYFEDKNPDMVSCSTRLRTHTNRERTKGGTKILRREEVTQVGLLQRGLNYLRKIFRGDN